MLNSNIRFRPRKSIDEFLSESLINRIFYECLNKTAKIPDDTILTAFNKAYQTSVNVLAEPERQTLLSYDLKRLAANAPRSSLLGLCLTYLMLSFHEEAPCLGQYLANLKEALETHQPEVFHSLTEAASLLAPEAVTLNDIPCETRPDDSVKIYMLIRRALELPKNDADILLNNLLIVINETEQNWKELLKVAILFNKDRLEPTHSIYHIREGQLTNFLKILRALFDLHIILDDKGRYAPSFEALANAFCEFLNTHPSSIHSSLHEGKRVDEETFMDVFNRLRKQGRAFYYGKDLPNAPKDTDETVKHTFQESPQTSLPF